MYHFGREKFLFSVASEIVEVDAAEMETSSKLSSPPHVLLFPFPAQGHINAMLKLAELLALSNIHITFLNTQHSHDSLVRFTDVVTRFSNFPAGTGSVQFKAIPDGLPEDHPRKGRFLHLFESMKMKMKPSLEEILVAAAPPINCIVVDVLMEFVYEVGEELEIPVLSLRTTSAATSLVYLSFPDIIDAGELPIGESNEDMNRPITKVAGMENFLRCRDLPGLCRSKNLVDPTLNQILKAARGSCRARALILNTFEDLEGPILSHIRTTHIPNIYSIGPLHEHLRNNKLRATQQQQEPHKPSNNLLEENRSCISWLDKQPPQSVLYVSFGSITVMTTEQVLEFWHGLVGSKQQFLWVIRPDSVTVKKGENSQNKMPTELVDGVIDKGHMVMVGWAPQEEVLGHKAVGGFLTHSGWNSTLESIVAGVPMICWPYFGDQQLNSRFVSEVWQLGLDMKDVCNRRVVEKMVHELMVERREEFVSSATKMKASARRSVSPGGSSHHNLELLIEDIKSMSTSIQN